MNDIRPDHLVLGTHADNVADRVKRGRSATGTRNGRAKLTPDDVRAIRTSTDTVAAIARRHGVDRKLVRNIRERKLWKDVTDAPQTSQGTSETQCIRSVLQLPNVVH